MSVATAVLPNFGERARHVLCGISSRDVYTGEYPRARSAARHGLGPHSAIASAYDIDALNVSGGRATCKAGERRTADGISSPVRSGHRRIEDDARSDSPACRLIGTCIPASEKSPHRLMQTLCVFTVPGDAFQTPISGNGQRACAPGKIRALMASRTDAVNARPNENVSLHVLTGIWHDSSTNLYGFSERLPETSLPLWGITQLAQPTGVPIHHCLKEHLSLTY